MIKFYIPCLICQQETGIPNLVFKQEALNDEFCFLSACSKGHKSIETLKKKPYIEIIDLSGIQVEAYSSYVGGEVRLALYYDGKTIKPISGFSFSTNLNETLNTMELSKETGKINNYEGPAFMKLENVDII